MAVRPWRTTPTSPGGRAPLEIHNRALRVAGSPFLPLPCPAVRSVRIQARLRPVMGKAGIILRSSGPGTGLLLELGATGELVLRRTPDWEIPSPAAPESEVLGTAAPAGDRQPGPGSWQDLDISDDRQCIRVSLGGTELLVVEVP